VQPEIDHILIPLFDMLNGSRITIRHYQGADALAFFAAVEESRDRLTPWDAWPHRCRTLADAQRMIASFQADFILRQEMEMGIWQQASGAFLGSIMLRPLNWAIRSFEIGYWLRTSAEGQGYMGEALRLLVDFAFSELGANRMMLRIDARNTRSLALAERAGFVREGCLRNAERAADGTLRNMIIMAQTLVGRSKSR
jgi:ribosomal-protein-serine acetyltransferase